MKNFPPPPNLKTLNTEIIRSTVPLVPKENKYEILLAISIAVILVSDFFLQSGILAFLAILLAFIFRPKKEQIIAKYEEKFVTISNGTNEITIYKDEPFVLQHYKKTISDEDSNKECQIFEIYQNNKTIELHSPYAQYCKLNNFRTSEYSMLFNNLVDELCIESVGNADREPFLFQNSNGLYENIVIYAKKFNCAETYQSFSVKGLLNANFYDTKVVLQYTQFCIVLPYDSIDNCKCFEDNKKIFLKIMLKNGRSYEFIITLRNLI